MALLPELASMNDGTSLPLVSVVIVNYDTPELVEQCVVSVGYHLRLPHEIIVVESGVKRPLGPAVIVTHDLRYVPTPERRGFGQANNLGAAVAKGRFLWLLNSDTVIPDDRVNGLFPLLDRNPAVGLLTPVLFNDRELIQRQPDFFSYFQCFRTILSRRLRPKIGWESPQLPELIPCEQITGASLIIRADLFRRLGGFDERYFMYMEDDDLCFRARQLGAKAAIASGVAVVHLQGKSISNQRERKRLYYASQNLFWRTHYGRWPAALMRLLRFPMRLFKG